MNQLLCVIVKVVRGGGKGPMLSNRSFTLATNNDQVLIVDGTRVGDVRIYEGPMQSVIQRWGTGGENVPLVMPTLSASNDPSRSPQSQEVTAQVNVMHQATSTVRRLTPMECERLQGFPDGWTDDQADSNRYKQMGNAVAVPCVEWIVSRLVEGANNGMG